MFIMAKYFPICGRNVVFMHPFLFPFCFLGKLLFSGYVGSYVTEERSLELSEENPLVVSLEMLQ